MGLGRLLSGLAFQATPTAVAGGSGDSRWDWLLPVLVGAGITLLAAWVAEWHRGKNERARLRDQRQAELQRATLIEAQEQVIRMTRAAINARDADSDATRATDQERRSEIVQRRLGYVNAHKDTEFRLDALRERLVDADLRSMLLRLQSDSRAVAYFTQEDRKTTEKRPDDLALIRLLRVTNETLGVAIREYEWRAVGGDLTWVRRQSHRLRKWRKRDDEAGNLGK